MDESHQVGAMDATAGLPTASPPLIRRRGRARVDKASAKSPAYFWYPKDAWSDEVFCLMNYEEQGVYRALLDRQWIEGSIPAEPAEIARLLKIELTRFEALWAIIHRRFAPSEVPGRLVNLKLERVRNAHATHHKSKSSNGKKGAERRWQAPPSSHDDVDGKRMANPSLSDGKPPSKPITNTCLPLPIPFPLPERVQTRAREDQNPPEPVAVPTRILTSVDHGDRVRLFVERYPRIYAKVRSGALYRVAEARDFGPLVEIVDRERDDGRLDALFEVFLHLNRPGVPNKPGSPRQFLACMPECDQLLREAGR